MHDGTDSNINESLLEQLQFKQADNYSLPLVKQFYKKNGMRAQAPKGELIYIASIQNTIVAAVRLSPAGATHLLRSMCVSADKRQCGIGTALLNYLQPQLNDIDCYCFPFIHLQSFYEKAGFSNCTPESCPEPISDKFCRYINNGKNICLMKHHHQSVLK